MDGATAMALGVVLGAGAGSLAVYFALARGEKSAAKVVLPPRGEPPAAEREKPAELKRLETVLANIEAYRGDERGQIKID